MKMNITNGKSRFKFLFKISFCIIILMLVFIMNETSSFTVLANSENVEQTNNDESEFCYLSDIPYITSQSSSAWKSICKNQTIDGNLISVKVEGTYYTFEKGLWAHATSTIVYDLTNYSQYDYFTTYVGLNKTAATTSNGVKFYIYTSKDGQNWDLKTDANPTVMKAGQNAMFLKIDIRDAKYLKLYANDNGQQGNDHSVYANPKLIKETYKEPGEELVPTIEELDNRIKTEFANADLSNEEYELTLLQREFVSRVGSYTLRNFCNESAENNETVSWLMNDVKNLRPYLVGGKPEGTYLNSLKVLTKMYTTCKEDLNNKTVTKNGTVLGDLYHTMMLSISLTHSGSVYLWIDGGVYSDPVNRYEIYKKLHKEEKIESKIFESLTVEEMRWVMNTIIDDESIEWLNNYTRNDKNGATGPYSYIRYTFGYNYWLPKYYSAENYEMWDKKYHLSDYKITYQSGRPKLWIVFEEGSVCGGLSKTGSCVWGSYKGLPNTCVSQPGHCAYIYYSQDSKGNGIWGLGNDVYGWGKSGRTEHLNVRTMNDWGSGSYTSGYNASYILLAQAAQNEYEKYEKAEEILMLINSYSGDAKKQEEIYRKALEVENINFDAWLGLVNIYKADTTKTEADYYKLAEEIAATLTYYPRPMYDLLGQLESKMVSPEYSILFTLLRTRTLTTAKNASDKNTIQVTAVRQVATVLLGLYDPNVATFSFDGENAGAIKLSSQYEGVDVQWDYSLDGGKSWTDTGEHNHKLTKEEIATITAESDIKVHIIGVDYSADNIFTIDIVKGTLPTDLYANDLENRIIGAIPTMEWKFKEEDEWTSYSVEAPDLTGDKTVMVRNGATGTSLPSDTTRSTFTEDNQPDTRKYIPISHLSVHQVSSQATANNGHAAHAIDGNINTLWHTDYAGGDSQRYITIKLDEPVYLSALEYVPRESGSNGRIKNGKLYVSTDGNHWNEVADFSNWANNSATKVINLNKSVEAQYVKLVTTSNYGDGRNFVTARMINLFRDTTKTALARFSFDGEDAGKIKLIDIYNGHSWKYSLDGGENWKEVTEDSIQLTKQELNQINAEDKIEIRIEDLQLESTIDIEKGETPASAYLNDLENRVIGVTNKEFLEWKLDDDSKEWTDFVEEEPVVTGNKKLLVRAKATGLYTASDSVEYDFTEDENSDTEKYIPISHLSIEGCSTESPERGEPVSQAIDGNINTMWHTDHTAVDDPRYIIIKLDEPRYISKLQYARQPEYTWGVLKNGIISTSMDGENWEEAVVINNLYNPSNKEELIADSDIKDILFEESKEALYIKIQSTQSCDYVNGSKNGVPYDYFLAASMLNLFEDTTKKAEIPTAEIEYDITELTNTDVIAKLVNSSTEITITNNGGKDTYTFTENGEFEFEFIDSKGTKGSVIAKVDWIDKENPVATISYDINELTNSNVVATLECDEEIIITNNDGEATHTFTDNGEFEFTYKDKAGNEGKTIAKVDWIDKEAPVATISYDINEATNSNVVATLECDEEITIINNDGEATHTFTDNGEFEFIYTDKLGNEGRVTAKVNWIDREVPVAKVTYDITETTGNNVVATLECDEEITITNNGGKDTYTFTENGEFEFTYKDKAGNEGKTIAKVDWIDKELPKITVSYNIEEPTNKDVIVKIVSDKEITITNNGGKDTYTFTKNGEFVFEYVTKAGKTGEVTVKVDWIDKDAPIVKVSYDITEKTTQKVVATLEANEDIIVTNNDGKDTYTFTENGEFEFTYRDKAGNEGKVIAKVDWIIKEEPTPSNKPTPTPSESTVPTPSNKPTSTPSGSTTPSGSSVPTSSTTQNNKTDSTSNKTSGNNSNVITGEDKTQTKTTTSNNELPYTGYENVGVAFRKIAITISILVLLVIAAYSFYKMKKG